MATRKEIKDARKIFMASTKDAWHIRMNKWTVKELKEHCDSVVSCEQSAPAVYKNISQYIKVPKSVDGMLGFLIDCGYISVT